jgi:hypothetical protein
MEDLLARVKGQEPPPGDMYGFKIQLPINYEVVYSIEEQTGHRRVRHLSVSLNGGIINPNTYVVKEIMKEIGFKSPLEHCFVSWEEFFPGLQSINVIEEIK